MPGVPPKCRMFMLSGWSSSRCSPITPAVDPPSEYLHQIFTGKLPFSDLADLNVHLAVMKGKRPSKPVDASKLGLSSKGWKLVEDCWNKKRDKRPEIHYVAHRMRELWYVFPIGHPGFRIPKLSTFFRPRAIAPLKRNNRPVLARH